ncbi:MAG: hypothetical protein ACE5EM_02620 [Sphingomonadales bacterium]
MRLKTFTAPSMKEAMTKIRAAVGPDAIIVSNARGRGGRGVTVTVAIEPDLARPQEPQKSGKQEAPLPNPAIATARNEGEFDPEEISRALAFHRVPKMLAGQLDRAARAMEAENAAMALASAFDTLFRFSPLPDIPRRPIMLIGPCGTGKTVTAAKLAARATFQSANVRIITLDVARAGAVEQLDAFARPLKCGVEVARNRDDLSALLQQSSSTTQNGFTIIDSPGTNPYNKDEISDLRDFISAADIEPVLTLSTGSDAREAAFVAEVFGMLGSRRLILTGVDAARRYGDFLAAADAGQLSFAEMSRSPFVADGLTAVNPVTLARLMVRAAEKSTSSSCLQEATP